MMSYHIRSVAALFMLACDASAKLDYQEPTKNLAHSYAGQLAHRAKSATVHKSDIEEYAKMVQVDSEKGLSFYWSVDNRVLSARMVYAGKAWLGFAVEPQGEHTDKLRVVIGKPKSKTVNKYSVTGNDWKHASKRGKHHQTLLHAKIEQTEDSTIMSFKKILQEDDEIAINPNGINKFKFVIGKENKVHNPRGSFTLKLDLSTNAMESKFKDGASSEDKAGSMDKSAAKQAAAKQAAAAKEKAAKNKAKAKDKAATKETVASKDKAAAKDKAATKAKAETKAKAAPEDKAAAEDEAVP